MDSERVLSFWLGELDAHGMCSAERSARWWAKDPALDAAIRAEFGPTLAAIMAGEHQEWLDTPRGRLAYVIVLDQFSRNIHRGTAQAFAGDERALLVALDAIDHEIDRALREQERVFLYMPLMHSESFVCQERCVSLFRTLCAGASDPLRALLTSNLDFAIRHRDVVAAWGRFPHRNEVLGRQSTEAELAFLQQPGSSF
jgi:uncharacterized protein (DUF924 family)